MTILSLDLGASNLRAAIISKTKVINKLSLPTPKSKKAILKTIYKLIDSYHTRSETKGERGHRDSFRISSEPNKITIGVAAFTKNGKTYATPNWDFNQVNISSLLKKRYKVPIYVGNDADCAGLAEKYYGHGRGRSNFVVYTLGTGIGGAIFISGKLYKGEGFSNELGHIRFNDKKLESLASGPASVALARKMGFKGITSLELEAKANKGNKKALSVYNKVGEYLGNAFLNIAYILDPEIIILGGGFSKVKHIYPSARKVLKDSDIVKRNIPILHAKLGDDAGLIGAALLPKIQ